MIMNKEEIQEALKIIREPIVVNCTEYKYFDQENYDKLVRTYENCRWFIDNWEQFEQNVEYQRKEIDRLNNVINELEKQLINETEKLHNISGDNFTTVGQSVYQEILDKLKELKEGK